MSMNLSISIVLVAIFLVILTTYMLVKNRINEKYAILWYAFSIITLIVSIFPSFLYYLSKFIGFQLVSNMVIVILIGVIFLLIMALTVMISGQKKKTILLIQEVALLKERVSRNENIKK